MSYFKHCAQVIKWSLFFRHVGVGLRTGARSRVPNIPPNVCHHAMQDGIRLFHLNLQWQIFSGNPLIFPFYVKNFKKKNREKLGRKLFLIGYTYKSLLRHSQSRQTTPNSPTGGAHGGKRATSRGESVACIMKCLICRAGLTIRGAPYQRKAGALFSYAKSGFSYLWRCTFFPKCWRPFKRNLMTFLVVVTFKRTLNVKRQNSVVKIWQLIGGGPWRRGPPPMVQPAQWIIRPCLYVGVNEGLRGERAR